MNLRSLLLFIVSVILSFAAIGQRSFLQCGLLLDVATGENLPEMTVVTEGDKIVDVKEGYIEGSDKDLIVDLRDQWVMPGWIDMHVHIEHELARNSYINRFTKNKEDLALDGAYYAALTLKAGFTTVRDLGGTGANVALRNAINKGKVPGPRIYTCRKSLAISGGHADPSNGYRNDLMGTPGPHEGVVDGAEEGIKAVRWQIKNGADWIKITATGGVLSLAKDGDRPAFNDDELKSIVQTAADRGIQVAAHCHGKEGMIRALKAGVKTIEHDTYADEEVFALLKEKNAYLIPTITAGMAVADSSKIDGFFPDVVRPKAARIGPIMLKMFGEAYKAGTPIGFGTDAGVFPHGKNAYEFKLMTDAGMPLIKAIQCATIVNAEILGEKDRFGSIEAGKLADIVAVPLTAQNNPIQMMQVSFVMKEGQIIK